MPRVLTGICVIWLLLLPSIGLAEQQVPALRARITDLTQTLSSEQQAQLESRLQKFEQEKGSQLAVLIVPTTQPEAIEQYSLRVVETWKLGREQQDDGILLLVAKEDRKLRIEVSHGLEGAVPDALAKRIIEEIITPQFKRGDFFGGISAGLDSLIKLVSGENLPPPESSSDAGGALVFAVFFGLITGGILRSYLGRMPAAVAGGLAASLVGGLFYQWLIAPILGAGVFVFNMLPAAAISQGGQGNYRTRRHSSWGGGGSFGGGGFSGGGGSFGGGGSSGSW